MPPRARRRRAPRIRRRRPAASRRGKIPSSAGVLRGSDRQDASTAESSAGSPKLHPLTKPRAATSATSHTPGMATTVLSRSSNSLAAVEGCGQGPATLPAFSLSRHFESPTSVFLFKLENRLAIAFSQATGSPKAGVRVPAVSNATTRKKRRHGEDDRRSGVRRSRKTSTLTGGTPGWMWWRTTRSSLTARGGESSSLAILLDPMARVTYDSHPSRALEEDRMRKGSRGPRPRGRQVGRRVRPVVTVLAAILLATVPSCRCKKGPAGPDPCALPAGCPASSTWTQPAHPALDGARGIWGSSPCDVWAVGAKGAILHWNGTAWSTHVQPGGGGEQLYDIHGVSAARVFAVTGSRSSCGTDPHGAT